MVNLQITVPGDYDPRVKMPLEFLRQCVEGVEGAADHCYQALRECETLRADNPDAAYVQHVSGLVALVMHNREAAMRFFAGALERDTDYGHARESLENLIATDPDWPDTDAYLEVLERGADALLDGYMTRARTCFAAGGLDEADRLGQRVSAFKRVSLSQLLPLSECREQTRAAKAAGTLAAKYAGVVKLYERHWRTLDVATLDGVYAEWGKLPDRRQLAALVAEAAASCASASPRVFEVGCLGGFNLEMARARMPEAMAENCRFGGLEPNADAIAHGRARNRWIDFVEGTAEDMVAGKLAMPDAVDVCVISRVLMILHPDVVAAILDYLAERVARFVICDDIMNVDGDDAIIRQPGEFEIMHPFEALFAARGFEIERREMAERPDRECTGFLVAVGR